jgi:DNA-binding MarR family transcriptional regulator
MGGDVRWLDDSELKIWHAYTHATVGLEDCLDRQLRSDSGMSLAYYTILVSLAAAPERAMRMNELADLSHSSRSRLSHAVTRLEQLGWVARRTCELDRRGAVAYLTDVGVAALDAAAPGHVAAVRRYLFDVLSPQQLDALQDIAQTIYDGLRGESKNANGETANDGTASDTLSD